MLILRWCEVILLIFECFVATFIHPILSSQMCVSPLFSSSVCFLEVNDYFKLVNTRDVPVWSVFGPLRSLWVSTWESGSTRSRLSTLSLCVLCVRNHYSGSGSGVFEMEMGRCSRWRNVLDNPDSQAPLLTSPSPSWRPAVARLQLWLCSLLPRAAMKERVKIPHAGRALSTHA